MTEHDPIAEQLAEWRERFTNRRTVPWEMLQLAEAMIRTAAEHHSTRYDVALTAVREEHEQRSAEHESHVDALKSTIDSQAATIASLKRQLEERRSLYEARRDAGDGDAEVTIRRDDHLHAWRLSDLEEIAFRLRCGGGTDDTPVDMASNRAVAVVPVPNLVTLEHRAKPMQLEPPEYDVVRHPGLRAHWRTVGLLVACFVLAIAGVVLGSVVR